MKWYWNISTQWCQLLPVLVRVASTRKSNEMILKHIKHKYAYCYWYLYWWYQHGSQMKQCWNISNINMPIVNGTNTGSINMEVKWNNTETYQTQWCQFLLVLVPVASTQKSSEMILKHIQHNVANCYRYWYWQHQHRSQMKEYWNISNTMLPIVTGIGTGSINTEVKWNDAETYPTQCCQLLSVSVPVA